MGTIAERLRACVAHRDGADSIYSIAVELWDDRAVRVICNSGKRCCEPAEARDAEEGAGVSAAEKPEGRTAEDVLRELDDHVCGYLNIEHSISVPRIASLTAEALALIKRDREARERAIAYGQTHHHGPQSVAHEMVRILLGRS